MNLDEFRKFCLEHRLELVSYRAFTRKSMFSVRYLPGHPSYERLKTTTVWLNVKLEDMTPEDFKKIGLPFTSSRETPLVGAEA